MKVFRLCKISEIDSILKTHSFSDVGFVKNRDAKLNNHPYEKNYAYLHFFLNLEDIFYLNPKEGYFICTYEIPTDILEKYQGIGYYLDYVFYREMKKVLEYAIPIQQIKFDYLEKVEMIVASFDFEDLLDYPIEHFTNLVYQKERTLKKIKEK